MTLDQFLFDASANKASAQETALLALLNVNSAAVTLNERRNSEGKRPGYPLVIRKNSILKKYWHNRYSLFSRYDEGIELDKESWYSVTPEQVAVQTAIRCKSDTIIDAFCGAGGNAIQFAFTCKRVIAIDIDPLKIILAINNAKIYGVKDKITFICGDFFQLAKKKQLKADVVFLAPPWGGPEYRKIPEYDLEKMPSPFSHLLAMALEITPNVAAFLPRNSNRLALVKEAGPGGKVEIEENFLAKKVIGVTAYYNALVKYK